MEKYRITITNLDTGETAVDERTNCIIGALGQPDDEATTISVFDCSMKTIIFTMLGIKDVMDDIERAYPGSKTVLKIFEEFIEDDKKESLV